MNLDEIKETFFTECAEQLAEVESAFCEVQLGGLEIENVNAIFRAVHSIKGGAGAFGFTDLVSFSHVVENALDIIRNDISQATDDRLNLLARSMDVLSDIVDATRDDGDKVDDAEITAELKSMFNLGGEGGEQESEVVEIDYDPVPISLTDLELGDAASGAVFKIVFEPKPSLYQNGHDPQRILRHLAELGTCTTEIDDSGVPALDALSPDDACLRWTIRLETESGEEEVREVFEWVESDCTLSIELDQPEAEGGADIDDILSGLEDFDIGEDPDAAPAKSGDASVEVTEESGQADVPVEAVAEAVPDEKKESSDKPAAAANKNQSAKKASQTIRVESQKVDRLINLMGELVINQAMVSEQVTQDGFSSSSPTALLMVEFQNLTREVQESVMAIRAQPVKPLFMRMSRILREVCAVTGKKAALVLEGENTEVDTTVIEGLTDPLTHMIRNSIDHGIEAPEVRVAAGKPETGTIKLSALHSSGRIVINVDDDGAGINRERVLQMGIEKGIVSENADLSDNEIDSLIMAPGFSTAEAVTDLSGRGVGMDVVRQSIQSLGGRISISSTPGQGSQFSMSMPLTLAILDGMVVRAAGQVFVIPVSAVLETFNMKPGDVHKIGNDDQVLKLRGNLVPIIQVGHQLGFSNKQDDNSGGTVLVVEAGNNAMAALLVDSIDGQRQVVIKSLESNYDRVPCIAAATIMGNGQIALILDVEEIVARQSREAAEANSNFPKMEMIA